MGLALYLRHGGRVDPAEVATWSSSPAGHQLMGRSGDAWCRASIKGGTPPAVAEAAARRTFAAYTASDGYDR